MPPLAEIIATLAKAEREGKLAQRIGYLTRSALLIIDEVGYLPIQAGGANLFFQLINARYERGAIILTSNRGFGEWGEVFGDSVVAAALVGPVAASRHCGGNRRFELPAARTRQVGTGKSALTTHIGSSSGQAQKTGAAQKNGGELDQILG